MIIFIDIHNNDNLWKNRIIKKGIHRDILQAMIIKKLNIVIKVIQVKLVGKII